MTQARVQITDSMAVSETWFVRTIWKDLGQKKNHKGPMGLGLEADDDDNGADGNEVLYEERE